MRRLLIIALLLLPAPLMADGPKRDCFCRGKGGERILLGTTVCMDVRGKHLTMQCQMSYNVLTWRKLADGCLSAAIERPQLLPQS